jgi:mannitol-1-phosphate/altronate dehydrogenase
MKSYSSSASNVSLPTKQLGGYGTKKIQPSKKEVNPSFNQKFDQKAGSGFENKKFLGSNDSAFQSSISLTDLWRQQSPYCRNALETGIVHFGPGRFFRAHLARIVHDYLTQQSSQSPRQSYQWGICGVSLKSHSAIATLAPQDFLYSLTERYDGEHKHECSSLIGSVNNILNGTQACETVLQLMSRPTLHLVTLTVTQAGYCLNQQFKLDLSHPEITHDLSDPRCPKTAIGFIVEALRRRQDASISPFTVLSCDNLPRNGDILRDAVIAYAHRLDANLANYIQGQVTFPNSVVDRIVPKARPCDAEHSSRLLNIKDCSPIVTEPFWQFVVEDKFSSDRPLWEDNGVTMTDDITPFLHIKSRFLNAVHTFIACLAVRNGAEYVHQALGQPYFQQFIQRLMRDIAAATPVPRSLCETYQNEVLLRFSNEALPDTIERISAETARKLGKYILPILQDADAQGLDLKYLVLPIAAWMLTVREGASELGQPCAINDKPEVIAAVQAGERLSVILELAPSEEGDRLNRACDRALHLLQTRGLFATLKQYSLEHFDHDLISAA